MTRAILVAKWSGKTGSRGLDSVQKRESRQSAASSPCGSCALSLSLSFSPGVAGIVRAFNHTQPVRIDLQVRRGAAKAFQSNVWDSVSSVVLFFCERNCEKEEPSRRSGSIATFNPEVGSTDYSSRLVTLWDVYRWQKVELVSSQCFVFRSLDRLNATRCHCYLILQRVS